MGLAYPTAALAAPAVTTQTVDGVVAHVARIDLRDKATVLTMVLARQPLVAPGARPPGGEEGFGSLAARAHAAVLANGTYFDFSPERAVFGTMVAGGRLVNHVAWRPRGTTFGLRAGNRPALGPAARAPWRDYWLAITAGPRLLAGGTVVASAAAEGFRDPALTRAATRTALGFDRAGHTLILASLATPVTLPQAARVMRALGADEALNLDGGTTRTLISGDRVHACPGRPLTNALAVYGGDRPAPAPLAAAFERFTRVAVLPGPMPDGADVGPFGCGRRTALGRDFEGWRFRVARGRPAVYNHDGWLTLAGPGALGAPLPRPGPRLALRVRVGASPLALDLDDARGRPIARLAIGRTGLPGRQSLAFAGPDGRHRFAVRPVLGRLVATLDGGPGVDLGDVKPIATLRFAGPGAVQALVPREMP